VLVSPVDRVVRAARAFDAFIKGGAAGAGHHHVRAVGAGVGIQQVEEGVVKLGGQAQGGARRGLVHKAPILLLAVVCSQQPRRAAGCQRVRHLRSAPGVGQAQLGQHGLVALGHFGAGLRIQVGRNDDIALGGHAVIGSHHPHRALVQTQFAVRGDQTAQRGVGALQRGLNLFRAAHVAVIVRLGQVDQQRARPEAFGQPGGGQQGQGVGIARRAQRDAQVGVV